LKAYSLIGKELDSLADLISFGLAPSFMLVYQYTNYTQTDNNILLLTPLVIVIGSALRLAIFNVDTSQSKTFHGLPTPSSGLLIVFFSHAHLNSTILDSLASNVYFYPVFSIVISALLVSRIPMFSLKIKDLTFRNNSRLYIFLVISLLLLIPVIVIRAPWSFWLFLIFVAYIIYNSLLLLFTRGE
jgi:CDP-diacylglycerol--serine O-phosphatidyltransferase